MRNFKGKCAAITGAGSGIGRALAFQLAAEGCDLALSDIQPGAVRETARQLAASGVRITTAKVDVADRGAVYAWAERVAADHGRVNLVINNAGVAHATTLEAVSYDDFEWMMGINFWGVVYGTKAFLPHLKAAGEGHIVNLSSVFGLIALPTQGTYNAAKFAVRGFTESLRQELDLADCGVSATCVHPGGIDTNIARSAKFDPSVSAISGKDEAGSKRDFQKSLQATSPEQAASAILRAVRRNQRRAVIGTDARVLDAMQRLLPERYQVVMGSRLRKTERRSRSVTATA